MRSTKMVAVCSLGAGLVLFTSITGCSNQEGDCLWNGALCPGDPPPPPAPECKPLPSEDPGVIRNECGIFLHTEGNNKNSGKKEEPVLTFERAIELAKVTGKMRVYACAGEFVENVTLPAGLAVYGGIDCPNGWQIPDGLKTTLTASADTIPLQLGETSERDGLIRIQRLHVIAQSASKPGGSSIAAVVGNVEAELVDCSLAADKAKDGSPAAQHEPTPECTKLNGGQGSGVINDGNLVSAGFAGECVCDDGRTTHGGIGGEGGSLRSDKNVDIIWLPTKGEDAGVMIGDGAGGNPLLDSGKDCNGNASYEGGNGAAGAPGFAGFGGGKKGAKLLGELSWEHGYLGPLGTPGTPGMPGHGGGGGGGKAIYKTKNNYGDLIVYAGASGGGGGAGGCGGKGGLPGSAGGSSIALVNLSAKPLTLTNVHLYAGKAGKGGDGRSGQAGAPGGIGGEGGNGLESEKDSSKIGKGCRGGNGGNGGNGGHGGGGAGGHSLGIATLFDPSLMILSSESSITFNATNAGAGGTGEGDNGSGAPGQAAAIIQLLP